MGLQQEGGPRGHPRGSDYPYTTSPVAAGTTQEPVTSDTDPAGPVTTYPLQFVLVSGPILVRGGWAKPGITFPCGGGNNADLKPPHQWGGDGRAPRVGGGAH